jgi:hypothetical protein
VIEFLRQLPGVVQVEIGVEAKKPTSRIVQLRDCPEGTLRHRHEECPRSRTFRRGD